VFGGSAFAIDDGRLISDTLHWSGDDCHACASVHRTLAWR
jgi:hypothetical protein